MMKNHNTDAPAGAKIPAQTPAPLPCTVVQDLLPSYVEGLTSPETTRLIKQHLKSCPGCTAAEGEMRTPLPEAPPTLTPEDEKGVRFLKKVKKKQRIRLVSVIAGLLALFLLVYYIANVHTFSFPVREFSVVERGVTPAGRVFVMLRFDNPLAQLNTFAFASHYTDTDGNRLPHKDISQPPPSSLLEIQMGYHLPQRLALPSFEGKEGYLCLLFNTVNLTEMYFAGWGGGERLLLWQEGDDLAPISGIVSFYEETTAHGVPSSIHAYIPLNIYDQIIHEESLVDFTRDEANEYLAHFGPIIWMFTREVSAA